jgi:ABC-type multidrug transport system fused ATPase/permease subunit
MISRSKLRGPIGRIGPYAVAVFLSLAMIESTITGNPPYSAFAFGCFFIVFGIIEYHRTKLMIYLILGLLWGTGTWHSMALYFVSFLSFTTYIIHVIVSFGALFLTWPFFYGNEKLESNARRLFNLAAEHVHEAFNGFTDRPYSARKAEYSKDEIRGFARFMGGKKIVKSIIQKEAIILAFSMGVSPLKEPDLQQISYVSFDYEGNISVHISEYDYKRFKEELTFDQLCASLGDVFIRFLEYYKKGSESRIIIELKSGAK